MAIIQSALLSKGRGSAGSVTFRRLNGKTVVSEKPITVKNPDSFQQRRARMLFMVGINAGWALSPYFAAREKMSEVRNATGFSSRGSKLLPIQDFVKRAVNSVRNDSRVITQISAYAQYVPSKQVDYAMKGAVVDRSTSPVVQVLQKLDVTGLPKENSEISIGGISVTEGVIKAPVAVVTGAGFADVSVKVYVIVVDKNEGAINRYLVVRNVTTTVQGVGAKTELEATVQIPEGQYIHQAIMEVAPIEPVSGIQDYSLAVGNSVLLNG